MLARLAQGRLYYGWIIVLTLSITQLTSWGILYYGFSVIMPAMQRELGWSRVILTGGFSLALVISGIGAVPVGHWLDRNGTRTHSARLRVSPQQRAQFRLELVAHDPPVVRCTTCGAEWRPMRLPRARAQNTEWHCRNGCHQPLTKGEREHEVHAIP